MQILMRHHLVIQESCFVHVKIKLALTIAKETLAKLYLLILIYKYSLCSSPNVFVVVTLP